MVLMAIVVDADAFHVFYDQKGEASGIILAALNLRCVWVIKPPQPLRSPQKGAPPLFAPNPNPPQLRRPPPIQFLIMRQIDFAHAAAAKLRHDLIAADALIRF